MPRDVVDAVADGVIAREEAVNAVALKATAVPASDVLREADDGDSLVREVLRVALAIAASHLDELMPVAKAILAKEAKAIAGKDPRLVPAVQGADVKAARERRKAGG